MPPTLLLYSQNGTIGDDRVESVVSTADGNIVVSGYANGDGVIPGVAAYVFAAKLDADGEELWHYEVKYAALHVSL